MYSGRDWYWQNYDASLKWQERHHRAYWRSKALALEYERDALLEYIRSTSSEEKFVANYSEKNGSYRRRNSRKHSQFYSNDNIYSSKRFENSSRNRLRTFQRPPRSNRSTSFVNNNSGVNPVEHQETELDKDVIEFFKQSMLHKMELREKRKASGESDSATESSSIKRHRDFFHASTDQEMNFLYGEKSAMIRGMETAMQLSFERNCDKLNPVYWPVIPLKS
ncbi:hypothetical protein J437_LFUL007830 [Ladona fulva]|uniref:Gem-associated protein 8 n=1 Tax=Ladona fulva TaxID=123851 RepID=A0A8K0JU94_LADFU|nr:hypothetical protein J437_LFUL007830 [Ladona fulva]